MTKFGLVSPLVVNRGVAWTFTQGRGGGYVAATTNMYSGFMHGILVMAL